MPMWNKYKCKILGTGVLFVVLGLAACSTHVTTLAESSHTLATWQQARDFQAQGRFELAKQYYQLALAGARTTEAQSVLKREIDATSRMLEAQR